MTRSSALLLLALVVLIGCESPFASDDTSPALLEYAGNPAAITVPTSVARNTSFDVVFTTYLWGCMSGEIRAAHYGREVRIWAVQRMFSDVSEPDCRPDTRAIENRVSIKMPYEGIGIVRVFGMRDPGSEPIILQRELTVTER